MQRSLIYGATSGEIKHYCETEFSSGSASFGLKNWLSSQDLLLTLKIQTVQTKFPKLGLYYSGTR